MALGKVDYDVDNLVTATKDLITSDALQLESGVVVRGEVLKKGTTGLVKFNGTSDVPYCVALQNIDASGGAKDIVYTYDASLLGSELTFADGDLATHRDAFVSETNLFIEE